MKSELITTRVQQLEAFWAEHHPEEYQCSSCKAIAENAADTTNWRWRYSDTYGRWEHSCPGASGHFLSERINEA